MSQLAATGKSLQSKRLLLIQTFIRALPAAGSREDLLITLKTAALSPGCQGSSGAALGTALRGAAGDPAAGPSGCGPAKSAGDGDGKARARPGSRRFLSQWHTARKKRFPVSPPRTPRDALPQFGAIETPAGGLPAAPSGRARLPPAAPFRSRPLVPPGLRSPSLPGCLNAIALARSPPWTATPGPWWPKGLPCGCQGWPGGM